MSFSAYLQFGCVSVSVRLWSLLSLSLVTGHCSGLLDLEARILRTVTHAVPPSASRFGHQMFTSLAFDIVDGVGGTESTRVGRRRPSHAKLLLAADALRLRWRLHGLRRVEHDARRTRAPAAPASTRDGGAVEPRHASSGGAVGYTRTNPTRTDAEHATQHTTMCTCTGVPGLLTAGPRVAGRGGEGAEQEGGAGTASGDASRRLAQ